MIVNLKVKIDWEFEIDLSTKKDKPATVCNGAGQVNVDDSDIKRDGCDECVMSGSFDAQIENILTESGNQYFLEKYITDTDMEKMILIRDLLRLRQKYFECHE